MQRTSSSLSICWVLLTAMVGGLSVMYLVEWRSARDEKSRQSEQLAQAVRELSRRVELSASQSSVILKAIRAGQDNLLVELKRRRSDAQPVSLAKSASDPLQEDAPAAEVEAAADGPDPLPPVPEGVDPESLLKQGVDWKALAQDARFNPKGRELSRTEKLKVKAEVTRARAMMEILDSDIQTHVGEGMEDLRKRGDYMEYAKGDPFEGVEGVLSAGEEIDNGGVRMFYLYPEEFPKLYKAKTERDTVAETAVRRLLSIFAGDQPVSQAAPESPSNDSRRG